jgi:WD40 repeat protein
VFSPDGNRVVTASDDHTARVWDVATGKPLTPPLQHQAAVMSATFSPDGARIVTASWDKTARVWDAATGRPLAPPLQHESRVTSAAFSPDGIRILTASCDKTARVWDAATGKLLAPPLHHQIVLQSFTSDQPLPPSMRHRIDVSSAAFSPDGTRVVTVGGDTYARIWDAETGKLLAPPLQHQDKVLTAAFSPDGTHVVTNGQDFTGRIWDLPLAAGSPADWHVIADRASPYIITHGALSLRP